MEIREVVDGTQKYWEEVVQAIRAHASEINRLRRIESDLFGNERYGNALSAYEDYEQRAHLWQAASVLMSKLVRVAIKEFSPSSSSPIEIDWNDIAKAVGFANERRPEFNAHVFWKELENRYGGSKGATNAYQQAAGMLINEFRIKPEAGIQRRRDGIVLNLGIRAEHLKYSNRYRIDGDDERQIGRTAAALKSFASWAGLPMLEQGMTAFVKVWVGRDQVNSRESFVYGDGGTGQIKITTYYNRFEFVFDARTSEKLQLFLGEYGFTPVAEAA
ncbi:MULTISPECIES: hypothetical protein [Ralstonia]|jgi:hypothetical protein|uniref:DUF4942 domain-containing protein n=2 Tax=Ralstonia pickettii TaxID=329 RepID=R0E8N5_RALPI|nr:hypothetical protein [Ralstonia pickettii]ENZ77742.1 hypothetical protein OR214_02018 [Ralstonia pickettii OR214]